MNLLLHATRSSHHGRNANRTLRVDDVQGSIRGRVGHGPELRCSVLRLLVGSSIMERRQNPLFLSFPAGTWFATPVRISVFFPLMLLIFGLNLGLSLGLIVAGLLFISVVIHEFAHVFAARLTGGDAEQIVMWPAGGLALCETAPTFRSEFLTPAAGPLSNLVICLLTLPLTWSSPQFAATFHPLELPALSGVVPASSELPLLLLAINIKLVYLNLLPTYPMDGGRMLMAVCARWWDPFVVRTIAVWAGMIAAIGLIVAGYCVDPATGIHLVSIGAFVLVMNLYETMQRQFSEAYDDSFLGYDFSQGYTSLEREETGDASAPKNVLAEWRASRESRRRERDRARRQETETRLDELLDKVHKHGMESLTEAEKRFLKKASTEFRSGEK